MIFYFFHCRFRIDNTDHIIDVNRDNLPYDQVNIICPVYAPGTSEEDAEKYIIYNVSSFISALSIHYSQLLLLCSSRLFFHQGSSMLS